MCLKKKAVWIIFYYISHEVLTCESEHFRFFFLKTRTHTHNPLRVLLKFLRYAADHPEESAGRTVPVLMLLARLYHRKITCLHRMLIA